MGKLENEDSVINHFSHEHPLKLLNFQPQTMNTVTCSGCKSYASGWIYICELCDYCLHKPCSKLPQTFSHKADQEHPLALLSTPAYPEGMFNCNACGCPGNGFSYHCPECELDLHPVCAFMPLSIDHSTHKQHTLNLCFMPPYENNMFSCDICKGPGSNHWLYRCDLCEFDAHMKCAKSNHVQAESTLGTQSRDHSQVMLLKSRSAPLETQAQYLSPPPAVLQHVGTPYIQTQYSFPGNGCSAGYHQVPGQSADARVMTVPQYAQPPRINNMANGLAGHVVEGIVDGMAQQVGQAILQVVLNS